MEKITLFAIKNSRATILVIIAIVLMGLQTFVTMPRQEDPEITIRSAQVRTYFPGMSVSLIEDLIAKPLEKKIKEIPEIEDIKTTIRTGEVLIQPEIFDRYFDLDPIWQDLRNKMEDIKGDLPEGTQGPFVNDDFGRVAVVTIAMTGEGFTMLEMRDVARDLQDKISSMDSVSKVDIYGIQPERIYLDINAARLANYGFSFGELVRALKKQNIVLPGGSVDVGDRTITIEPSGNLESVEELRNIQVKVPEKEQSVYLRDIAEIRRSYVDPPQSPAYFNNKPAVALGVSMVPRYNIEDFGYEISAKTAELQATLPVGLQLEFATYQPELVVKSVTEAVNNLYQTIAVVLAVVVLFLGMRTGLIVGSIVPLTILLSLIAMKFWGIDLQRMSIASIIISLGLLVDNGIVIAEDMRRRMDMGEPKKDAAVQAAKTLGLPLFTSSLTTILAFTPLIMADDVSSEYLFSLSQVIITTLLSSWFLAMFATPVLCYWFLPEKKEGKKEDEAYSGLMYTTYRAFLKGMLRFRVLFILLMVGLFFTSLFGLTLVPQQMMPYSDRNQFLVYVDLPSGTDIKETIRSTRTLTAWLADAESNPEVTSAIAYVGHGGPRFFLALSPPNPGNDVAFVVVNTKEREHVKPLMARVDRFALEQMPEVSGRSKSMSLGAGEIGLVEYRIMGPDVATLFRLSQKFENIMKGFSGSVGVMNDWGQPVIRIKVEVDQNRARRANISSESIAKGLSAYFDGFQASDYREGDKVIPIVVRGDETRNDLSELRTLPILSEDGVPVPLVQVADFQGFPSPDKIKRYNQERTITVSGKHKWKQATALHSELLPLIERVELPEGYRLEFGGEVESSQKGNGALLENLPFAMIAIAVLLVLQFNSFRRPTIIMMTIPLVLIGAVAGLLVMKAFFSFTAMLGLFSLAGIIVNNGIVLIDRIDYERDRGQKVNEAIITACIARVRPILMTTLTTILGLIPLTLFGGDMWYPMAVVIMFGLASGTLLTLGLVPVLYSLLFPERSKA